MSDDLPRAVLDTVVFVQAMISGRGPAAACIDSLRSGRYVLLMSDATFSELQDIPLRPSFLTKYPYLTPETVAAFLGEIKELAVWVADPAKAFVLPRDPADEPFIDLAVAGHAQFLITWNERHLTYLMKEDTPEGREFCHRFPQIKILSPVQFLRELRM